jgi:hypothetical protein
LEEPPPRVRPAILPVTRAASDYSRAAETRASHGSGAGVVSEYRYTRWCSIVPSPSSCFPLPPVADQVGWIVAFTSKST